MSNMPISERKRRLDNMCAISLGGGGGGGSSEDIVGIQNAISELQNDINEMQNAPAAKINGVKLAGELDSKTDLKIAGKICESGGAVIGEKCDATDNALAAGYGCTAIDGGAVAIGNSNKAHGSCAIALGMNCTTEAKYSAAIGQNNTVSGQCACAIGNGCVAKGSPSIAIGESCNATDVGSIAIGTGAKAVKGRQIALGRYNSEDTSGKYVFIIGNGKGNTNRSNAIAIDWDGKIYVNNSETGVDLNTVIQDIANRYTKTETDSAIAAKIAEIIASAPESLDTLKEISDWIESHADSASAMNSDIQDNASAIAETNTKIDRVESSLKSEIETVTNDLTDDISAVETNMTNQIETVETNMTNQINTTNTAVNALQTDKMDKASIDALTLDEYNALAESEKTAEYYFIRED